VVNIFLNLIALLISIYCKKQPSASVKFKISKVRYEALNISVFLAIKRKYNAVSQVRWTAWQY